MYIPGPRTHNFFSWYHEITVLDIGVSLCLFKMFLDYYKREVNEFRQWLYILGSLFILWEATEVSYYIFRMGQVVWGHENLLGIYVMDSVPLVTTIHIVRTLIGTTLLWKGRSR